MERLHRRLGDPRQPGDLQRHRRRRQQRQPDEPHDDERRLFNLLQSLRQLGDVDALCRSGLGFFYIPYSTTAGGHTTTTLTYAKILSAASGVAPGTYSDTYSTAAQSWFDFDTWATTYPPITCGPIRTIRALRRPSRSA